MSQLIKNTKIEKIKKIEKIIQCIDNFKDKEREVLFKADIYDKLKNEFEFYIGKWNQELTKHFEEDQIFENFFISSMFITLTLIYMLLIKHTDIRCTRFHKQMKRVVSEFIELKKLFNDNWGHFVTIRLVYPKKKQYIEIIEGYMYECYDDVKLQMSRCRDGYTCPTNNLEDFDTSIYKPKEIEFFFKYYQDEKEYHGDSTFKKDDGMTNEKIDENLSTIDEKFKSRISIDPKTMEPSDRLTGFKNFCDYNELQKYHDMYRTINHDYIGDNKIRNRINKNFQQLKKTCEKDAKVYDNCIHENTKNYFNKLSEYMPENGLNPFWFPQNQINDLYTINSETDFEFTQSVNSC